MARFRLSRAWTSSLALSLAINLTACAPSEPQAVEPLRMLNHWDNPDGSVERGYAGRSIFWSRGGIDTLAIRKYGQKNEAIGINATVLNNVNASPKMLSDAYLDTTACYADLLRPYGIRVWLSVNFASPQALGATQTADPLDPAVQQWWRDKVADVYRRIPDFGGFLVKANSEGQPGPCDYGRSHAEGANMLADALRPHGGQVIWRAFVYSPSDPDRAKQAFAEFAPLDGQFASNVIIQIKNGPIDFQPREPVSPLFFAMPHTRLMAELQITQEYLGHSNHIAFLAPMWRETQLAIGRLPNLVGYAGVANVGTEGCGNRLAEANWFAFGRMAADASLSPDSIAREWVCGTFPSANDEAKSAIVRLLMMSRETVVDYMMPLGLHHIFAWGHHYGPEPWCAVPGARADWLPSYYHRADSIGLGFDRTEVTGTSATTQYPDSLRDLFEPLDTCPEDELLWFHHVPWQYERTWQCCGTTESLWEHLGRHYQRGVDNVAVMQQLWQSVKGEVSDATFDDIARRLDKQQRDAQWWRDACLLYFQTFSRLPWPSTAQPPVHSLDDMMRFHIRIGNHECAPLDVDAPCK
ncbi:MAG: alpha-glucuronidase [Bacteroidales bacterium]|nr:alpha-glucuronidase [Bacteroidales bacterium]